MREWCWLVGHGTCVVTGSYLDSRGPIANMQNSFKQGFKEGFNHYLPFSMGFIPWGVATGIAMRSSGLSIAESMGMNIIVSGGTAQLGTLPLIVHGAPLWLISFTALILNLRFIIFSATLAPAFKGVGRRHRWLSGYVLGDGVVAACANRLLMEQNTAWRYGYYLGPSLWAWTSWQTAVLVGVLLAGSIPHNLSLDFMATIGLLVLLIPMCSERSMLVSALVGGGMAVLLKGLPLRMGLFCAILIGMAAGYIFEQWTIEKVKHG